MKTNPEIIAEGISEIIRGVFERWDETNRLLAVIAEQKPTKTEQKPTKTEQEAESLPVEEDLPWDEESTADPPAEAKHTLDDIRSLVRALTAEGKSAVGKKIIKDHGYSKISEIPETKIESIYDELNAAKEGN